MNKLKVAYISAEVSPYAKTGGLADVAGALPNSLKDFDVDVITIMPRYGIIKQELDYVLDFPLGIKDLEKTCIIRTDNTNSNKTYFIDNHEYYNRDGIYGYYDDGERFAFFCKAVLLFLKKIGFKADIIHLNDWHTGPTAMLIKENYKDDIFFKNTKLVYTIHNLRYQGLFDKGILEIFDTDYKIFHQDTVEYYGQFNFMKAGIAYSDLITTVSQTYSKEILLPEFGEGLDGFLKTKSNNLIGIVNGIDIKDFNPKSQKDLYYPFDSNNISGKYKNKLRLKEEMGIEKNNYPVFSTVTRLADQKGLNLILESLYRLLGEGKKFQFILLGTGNPYYEDAFRELQNKYPNLVSTNIKFDLGMAKRIYAGSDVFLMPSKYEPCGLGQLISYRYGTIPIVRETGGLKDTVVDVDKNPKLSTGFTFKDFSQNALHDSMVRALEMYDNTEQWKKLVKKVMNKDFSWKNSAKKYKDAYHSLFDDIKG